MAAEAEIKEKLLEAKQLSVPSKACAPVLDMVQQKDRSYSDLPKVTPLVTNLRASIHVHVSLARVPVPHKVVPQA